MLFRQMEEHVALADLEAFAVLPRDPRAAEDEEHFLLRAFGVRRRRPSVGVDADALEAEGDAAGRAAEVVPVAGEVADFAAMRVDVVPVRNVVHRRDVSSR
jgi:hypothetical protein